jgi:hypothetical protein
VSLVEASKKLGSLTKFLRQVSSLSSAAWQQLLSPAHHRTFSFNTSPTANADASQTAVATIHTTIAHQSIAHQQSVMEAVELQIARCLETDFVSTLIPIQTSCEL